MTPHRATTARGDRRVVRIGTRGSALATWQARHVAGLIESRHPGVDVEIVVISTQGDRVIDRPLPQIGGKGLFTLELEAALRDGAIDLAVHSLKDLPTENPPGLVLAATPPRADPRDVLITRQSGFTLQTLPPGSTVGTSSTRRAAQLRRRRPDLVIRDIRGNVDTRIARVRDPQGPYDATLLAAAGIDRLGRSGEIAQWLDPSILLPAPGQGALAVQCRIDDADARSLLSPLDDAPTRWCVEAERAFLAALGGGCSVPVAALGTLEGATLRLLGRVNAPGGETEVDVSAVKVINGIGEARGVGTELAGDALARGAGEILRGQPA